MVYEVRLSLTEDLVNHLLAVRPGVLAVIGCPVADVEGQDTDSQSIHGRIVGRSRREGGRRILSDPVQVGPLASAREWDLLAVRYARRAGIDELGESDHADRNVGAIR